MDIDQVINSCRICQSGNQDGDFERLYLEETFQLTAAGRLYEELLGVEVDSANAWYYPQYLCNSCDLQMKLFKKLKLRAEKTLGALRSLYADKEIQEIEQEESILIEIKNENVSFDEKHESVNEIVSFDKKHERENETEVDDDGVSYQEFMKNENVEFEHEEDFSQIPKEETENVDTEGDEEYVPSEDELRERESSADETRQDEINNDSSQGASTNDESELFLEVDYLDDVPDDSEVSPVSSGKKPKKKKVEKKICCRACSLYFNKRSEYIQHRKEKHNSKFQCLECNKQMQTADALKVHMNLHRGLPAYECDLCGKTFNQKVHYNYHMAKHNNIRNFKCDICEKAFLSKGDLSIHVRSHTGDRRYTCDVCGKDFLLLIHMKNHRYSHFEKEFQCHICQQKFISPATLRTHIQSIHIDEPRFQCEYCVKKFRRKHHLIAHYRVHRKISVEAEYMDDDGCDEDGLLEVVEESELKHDNDIIEEEDTSLKHENDSIEYETNDIDVNYG